MTAPSEGFYPGRRVLVLGGAGAIGSNLCAALARVGASVVVLDNLSSGARWCLPDGPRVDFVHGDLLDPAALNAVFEPRPDVVFHLAAFFANQNSVDHPEQDLLVNGLGTLRVLEAAVRAGGPRVVFASTSAVYGPDAPLPLSESAPSTELETPYQITKLLGEMYGTFFGRHYGLPVVRVRPFNSYGPGELPGRYRNVVPNFVYRALLGEPLVVTGDPAATRDFTYVGDIVDGLLACGAVDAAPGEAFNLAAGREVSVLALATEILSLTGSSSAIEQGERRPWDHKQRRLASTEKAREVLGFDPRTTLTEGLAATVEWFRANWARIHEAAAYGEPAAGEEREAG